MKRPLEPRTVSRPCFMLVYQAGIANVFKVGSLSFFPEKRGKIERVYQGDFRTAEAMAQGAGLAGAAVFTCACNEAGDISKRFWSGNLEAQPFSESFHPVYFMDRATEIDIYS